MTDQFEGTALPSLIAALSGASSCTITDHPSSPALTTGAIEKNIEVNLLVQRASTPEDNVLAEQTFHQPRSKPQVDFLGYTWGTHTFYLPPVYGKPAPPDTTPPQFDRIIIADCLWMPSQHINLIRTILQYLPPAKSSISQDSNGQSPQSQGDEDVPCALVVAGFHTGRSIVSDFFGLATEPQSAPAPPTSCASVTPEQSSSRSPPASQDEHDPATINTRSLDLSTLTEDERQVCGKLRLAEIFEVDVDLNRREWRAVREGEVKWEAKRWCVVGVLVRR